MATPRNFKHHVWVYKLSLLLARDEAGLSVEELREGVQASFGNQYSEKLFENINNVEKPSRHATKTCDEIAKFLGVDFDYLFSKRKPTQVEEQEQLKKYVERYGRLTKSEIAFPKPKVSKTNQLKTDNASPSVIILELDRKVGVSEYPLDKDIVGIILDAIHKEAPDAIVKRIAAGAISLFSDEDSSRSPEPDSTIIRLISRIVTSKEDILPDTLSSKALALLAHSLEVNPASLILRGSPEQSVVIEFEDTLNLLN
jgi:hypothetical protein